MQRYSVLIGVAALVLAIAAMSAGGSGVRDVVDDVIDPDLTDEVEDLVARSLSEYSGVERTPSPPAPVPIDRIPSEVTSGVPTGMPPFVEIPGAPPAAPARSDAAAPQMIDDTPPLVAWGDAPPDAK